MFNLGGDHSFTPGVDRADRAVPPTVGRADRRLLRLRIRAPGGGTSRARSRPVRHRRSGARRLRGVADPYAGPPRAASAPRPARFVGQRHVVGRGPSPSSPGPSPTLSWAGSATCRQASPCSSSAFRSSPPARWWGAGAVARRAARGARPAGHGHRRHPARHRHSPRRAPGRQGRRWHRPRRRHARPRGRGDRSAPVGSRHRLAGLARPVLDPRRRQPDHVPAGDGGGPGSPVRMPDHFDLVGAVGLSLTLVGLLVVISKGADWGWTTPLQPGHATWVRHHGRAWVRWERRQAAPVVDLATTLRRPVLLTNMASVLIGFAMFCQFGSRRSTSSRCPASTGHHSVARSSWPGSVSSLARS